MPSRLSACPVGANPIIWSNDDFAELAGDVPLETILREMAAAGFAGTELGHAYPRTAAQLGPILADHGLRLAGGWHSTHLATRDFDTEVAALRPHLELHRTLGATVAIVAECSHCIHGDRAAPLGFGDSDRRVLEAGEWRRLLDGMHLLCDVAAAGGVRLAYHHHLGTVIQNGAELDRLLDGVPALGLVLDPGHLTFAGLDPLAVIARHGSRIVHCHLKSTRPEIVARARREGWSFCRAVTEGVFTIPGEGAVDFPAIFAALGALDYRGWLVVEAEEDPVRVPALPKAQRARAYVRTHAGA